MHPKKFQSKAALVAYAEQNGLTCLLESLPNGTDSYRQSSTTL
jgi:hypothetical protein